MKTIYLALAHFQAVCHQGEKSAPLELLPLGCGYMHLHAAAPSSHFERSSVARPLGENYDRGTGSAAEAT